MTEQPEIEMRRTPKSKRGQQRVAKILEAAAALFAEQGFEATTTNHIAARADTSIGSLYQFFPHKDSILEALAAHYVLEMRALVDAVGAAHPSASAADLFEQELDAVRHFFRANPGFRAVFSGGYGSEALAASTGELNGAMIAYVETALATRLPNLNSERCSLAAAVVMMMFDTVKAHLVDEHPTQELIYAELKRMVRLYLETLV